MKKTIKTLCLLAIALIAVTAIVVAAAQSSPAYAADEDGYTVVRIGTAEDFLLFSENCRNDGYSDNKRAVLTKDIDLTGLSGVSVPVFGGIFDGNYHTILGADIDDAGSYIGLFRYIKTGAIVRNLTIEVTIRPEGSKEYIGGLAGQNAGSIVECIVNGTVDATLSVGGIVGENAATGTIESSFNYAKVTGYYQIGGIAGVNRGTVSLCENRGEINHIDRKINTIALFSGGITGNNLGIVRESVNYGTIGYEEVTSFTGGIAGVNFATIGGCGNYGEIIASANAGGIAGQYGKIVDGDTELLQDVVDTYYELIFGADVEAPAIPEIDMEAVAPTYLGYSYNDGRITGTSAAGGIVGTVSSYNIVSYDIEVCYNAGTVIASESAAGGITGLMSSGIITDCFNTGEIGSSTTSSVGGIAGSAALGGINACFSAGGVNGVDKIGGIAGEGGAISQSYAYNYVNASGEKIGGIAGTVTDRTAVLNNYFVSSTQNRVYGIDGINYAGKAESVDVFDLSGMGAINAKVAGLSIEHWAVSAEYYSYPRLIKYFGITAYPAVVKKFAEVMDETTLFKLNIDFYGESGFLKRVRVPYGEDVNPDELPEIPVKEGYFVSWETYDGTAVNQNQTVNAVYRQGLTTVSAEAGGTRVLMEGLFHPDTVITLTEASAFLPVGLEGKYVTVKNFLISFTLYGEPVVYHDIRIKYNGEGSEDGSVILVLDNGFVLAASERSGEYLSFPLDGAGAFIIARAAAEPVYDKIWFYFALLAALGLLAGFSAFIVLKKRKNGGKSSVTGIKDAAQEGKADIVRDIEQTTAVIQNDAHEAAISETPAQPEAVTQHGAVTEKSEENIELPQK